MLTTATTGAWGLVASEHERAQAAESVRLLNFAQADVHLRWRGRLPSGAARQKRRIGDVFRVLDACTQHLTPSEPPRELVQQAIAESIGLDMRVIRVALQLLVKTGYLQRHGRGARGVGRYTIAAVRHGELVQADAAPQAGPARSGA